MRPSRNTSRSMQKNRACEIHFNVNKMIELVYFFFVRDDSNSRGRLRNGKGSEEVPFADEGEEKDHGAEDPQAGREGAQAESRVRLPVTPGPRAGGERGFVKGAHRFAALGDKGHVKPPVPLLSGPDPELRPLRAEPRIAAGAGFVAEIDSLNELVAERRQRLDIESLRFLEVRDGKPNVIEHWSAPSDAPLDHELLELRDGFGRAQPLRAGFDAIEDRMAAVEPERVLEIVEALAGRLVPAICAPAIGVE